MIISGALPVSSNSRGRSPGAVETNQIIAHRPTRTPRAPPAIARIKLSVSSWERIDRVLGRAQRDSKSDRSFLEFLEDRPGGRRLARERTLAREFVQGFHTADPSRVSERAIADGGTISQMMRQTARVTGGYDRVTEPLAAPIRAAIRLSTVVKRMEWSRGNVLAVASRNRAELAVEAAAAIITVPLGVLRAPPDAEGAIAFEPSLPERTRSAIARLEMGSVVRVTLVLRERIWERDDIGTLPDGKQLDRLGYLHSPHGEFNVWWTLFPMLEPVIVGWSGGPPANLLAAKGRDGVRDVALRELSSHLGWSRRRLAGVVLEVLLHDWEADPFSRGAYSHALVGCADAAKSAIPAHPRHLVLCW